jgi:hypothetical protein
MPTIDQYTGKSATLIYASGIGEKRVGTLKFFHIRILCLICINPNHSLHR